MKIALLGDLALIGRYDLTQNRRAKERVSYLKNLVSDCDFVVANLESPLTSITETRECKGVYLRSDPANIEMLKHIGVTHVTLANNHMFDYGKAGARETVEHLEKAGISHVGLNGGPALLSNGAGGVLLEGFCCYSSNATHYGTRGLSTSLLTPKRLEAFLKKASTKGLLPLASVHFGIEGLHYPAEEHIHLFEDMASRYDYTLHGHHPHAIQGIKQTKESLLCYSLGNALFDDCLVTSIGEPCMQTREEHRGLVAIIEIADRKVSEFEAIGVTDLGDCLSSDEKLEEELRSYSSALLESDDVTIGLRKEELAAQAQNRSARNLSFYKNRLNAKYIGAYRAGRSHARYYAKVMKDYL